MIDEKLYTDTCLYTWQYNNIRCITQKTTSVAAVKTFKYNLYLTYFNDLSFFVQKEHFLTKPKMTSITISIDGSVSSSLKLCSKNEAEFTTGYPSVESQCKDRWIDHWFLTPSQPRKSYQDDPNAFKTKKK